MAARQRSQPYPARSAVYCPALSGFPPSLSRHFRLAPLPSSVRTLAVQAPPTVRHSSTCFSQNLLASVFLGVALSLCSSLSGLFPTPTAAAKCTDLNGLG